ncbi:MAG: DUF3349 domain-containing protein [Dermatophilaceae bacterium]
MSQSVRSLPHRMLTWLRAGYPSGVPGHDYIALLGILHRQLTDVEVDDLAAELASICAPGAPVTEDDIRDLIGARIHEQADELATARVSAHLARGGWPLATIAAD